MGIGSAIDDRIGMMRGRVLPERQRHGKRGVPSEFGGSGFDAAGCKGIDMESTRISDDWGGGRMYKGSGRKGYIRTESIVPDKVTLASMARPPKPVPRLTAHASRLDSNSANSFNLCIGNSPLSWADGRKRTICQMSSLEPACYRS